MNEYKRQENSKLKVELLGLQHFSASNIDQGIKGQRNSLEDLYRKS